MQLLRNNGCANSTNNGCRCFIATASLLLFLRYCFITAVSSLLLHCCCFIATAVLLLHRRCFIAAASSLLLHCCCLIALALSLLLIDAAPQGHVEVAEALMYASDHELLMLTHTIEKAASSSQRHRSSESILPPFDQTDCRYSNFKHMTSVRPLWFIEFLIQGNVNLRCSFFSLNLR